MNVGELYQRKDLDKDFFEYSYKTPRKERNLIGFTVIELVEYIGDDKWRFKNRGSSKLSTYKKNIPVSEQSGNIIEGYRLFEEWKLIGKSSNQELLKEIETSRKQDSDDADKVIRKLDKS